MTPDSNTADQRTERAQRRMSRLLGVEGLLIVLLIGAAAFKAIYLNSYVTASPFFLTPASDSEVYLLRAAEIGRDGWIGDEVYYRAPLYPLLLYAVMSWSDFQPLPLHVLQLAMGLGTLVLLYLTASRICSPRGGIFAVLLAIGYAPMTFYETKMLATVPGIFLGMLFMYFLVRAEQDRRMIDWIVGSLALGLAIICRPQYLFVLPLFVGGMLWRYRRDGNSTKIPVAVCAGIVVALLSLVTLRNYYVSGDLVLISANSGVTFAQGNARGAKGSLTAIAGLSNTVIDQHVSAQRLAEEREGRPLSPSEVNSYWVRYALRTIFDHPGEFLHLLVRKASLILNNRELGSCYLIDIDKQLVPVLRAAFLPFGFILACAAVGLMTLRREGPIPTILLATVAGTVLIMLTFYVTTRYRMTLVPAALVLAGVGVDRFIAQWNDRKSTVLSIAVAFSVFVLATKPMLPMSDRELRSGDAGFWAETSVAFKMQQRHEEALEAIERAIAMDPQSAEFQLIHYDLTVTELSGPEEQLARLRTLVRAFPKAIGAYLRLGAVQIQMDLPREAIKSYQEALKLDATDADAWLGIGTAFAQIGESEMAYKSFGQGLQQHPTHIQLQLNYARVCFDLGRMEESRQWLAQVLQVAPENQEAQQLFAKLPDPSDN